MKTHFFAKRTLSLLLAAMMLIALFPASTAVSAAGSLTTLWDMETLPADLVAASVAVPVYADSSDYHTGNVTVTSVAGKGFNNTKALAVTQVGAVSWADIFTLYPERDYGASCSLGDANMLWFWANAEQFTAGYLTMEFRVDGRAPYIGDKYYVSSGSKMTEKTFPDSWDGIHGRVQLEARFKGWVGIPLASFVTKPDSLSSIYFYLSPNSADRGKTLYLDNFSVGKGTAAPSGVTFTGVSYTGTAATAAAPAWNMEALPDDLLASGLAASSGSVRRNVRVLRANGKGFGGSSALQILQYGPENASETITLSTSSATGFARNWRSGDMLMFWADASEFAGQKVSLDLTVKGKKLTAGSAWYKERAGLLVKAGTVDEPYANAGFGRLTLPDGFCGWVGIPLLDFKGGLHDASNIQLHLSYSGSDVLRKSLYLDNFWIISGNRLPAAAVTGAGTADIPTVVNANARPNSSSYINVNVNTVYQTMSAYGASDCWWTTVIGQRQNIRDALDLLWGKDGIALNNYRLNIGGAVQYTRSDSPIYSGRAVLSPLNENGVLDITRNAGSWNTYSTLLDMIDEGEAQIDDLTLFMNSPPSSMTAHGQTYADTLASDKYDDYGRFVADVVEAYENTGLHVKYVSPVNEPLVGNWVNNASQEGTVYTQASQIVSVFENTIDALNAKESTTKVSVSDFCNWSSASQYFSSIIGSSKIRNHIDHISAHDYGLESASYRRSFANTVHDCGLSVHMSEWCMSINENADTMDTALTLATDLYTDLTAMNCDTWSWWLGVGAGGFSDGLTYYSAEDNVIQTTKRLWALGNFSRFTVGATRIGVNTAHLPSGLSVMAFKKGSSLIYTLINENTSATSLSLAGLPAGSQAKMYVTSEDCNCELVGHVTADNAVSLPARSVVTVVFETVDLSRISSSAAPGSASAGRMLDMENANVSGSFSTNRSTLVSAYRASGAGFNGSDAAALSYNVWDSTYYWDTAFRLSPATLGAGSNWSAGDTLWFWADAGDFTRDTYLQVDVNDGSDRGVTIGSTWYLWDGSGAPVSSTAVKTWDGATTGRLLIPAGYCGFIGIPMSSFSGLNRSSVRNFSFYFEPQNETLPAVLYLDEFWLTASGSTPAVTFASDTPVCKDIFDMEALAEDLTVNSSFATFNGSLGTYVDAVVGQTNGKNGSYALGYRYLVTNPSGNGSNVVQISTAGLPGFIRDWSGADTFWFWVDASAFTKSFQLGVTLNWTELALGNTAKFWNGGTVQTAAIPVAYNNVARVTVPAGYTGFIGLPLSGYTVNGTLNLSDVNSIVFYYDCGSMALPLTLWIDELWVTSADALPKHSGCEHAHTQVIPGLDPTCTEPGLTEGLQCSDCGEVLQAQQQIAALGHRVVEDAAVAPTCVDPGLTAGTHCSVCNTVLTSQQTVPATGNHEYLNGVCIVCGQSKPVDAPTITSAYLHLNEDINLVFAAELPAGSTGVYIDLTMNGATRRVSTYTTDANGRYCFEFTKITPQHMGDSITAVLHATCGGRTYTDTVTDYSIRAYCENQLAQTNDAKLITLLSDLLTYGAAAQTYTDYKTNALVTSGLTLTPSSFTALSGKRVIFSGEKSATADWYSAALVLSNDLAMRFTFTAASVEGLSVNVTVNGRTETFTSFTPAGDGKYSILFRGIKATEFDDAVTASFKLNGTPVGRTVSYSVNAYICSTQNCGLASLEALVKALYNYGASAAAYSAK